MNHGLFTSSSPTMDLAREMNINPSQARDMLHEARRRKLLTKTQRGRAGGELTEKALTVLGRLNGNKMTDQGLRLSD